MLSFSFNSYPQNTQKDMSRLSVWGGPSASVFPIGNEKVLSSISHSRRQVHLRRRKTIRSCAADFKVLTSVTSNYNSIVILDTPQSRVLLLDSSSMFLILITLILIQFHKQEGFWILFCWKTDNVHSILHKETKWTGAYWVCNCFFFLNLSV